jgi:hypothetical protein
MLRVFEHGVPKAHVVLRKEDRDGETVTRARRKLQNKLFRNPYSSNSSPLTESKTKQHAGRNAQEMIPANLEILQVDVKITSKHIL